MLFLGVAHMVSQSADMIVWDANRRPALAIEIDNQKDLSEGKAIDFRREVLPHLGGVYAPHLLLISQDRAYLWSKRGAEDFTDSPSASFPMSEIVAHYG